MIKLLIVVAVAIGAHFALLWLGPSYVMLHWGVCAMAGLAAMSRVR